MEQHSTSEQLTKVINRLVTSKVNSKISEYGLGEGVNVSVIQSGKVIDLWLDKDIPRYYILIKTTNPHLSYHYFSDGYYALYNMISEVSQYVDPSRNFSFEFEVQRLVNDKWLIMDHDVWNLYKDIHTITDNPMGLLDRNLQRISNRLKES